MDRIIVTTDFSLSSRVAYPKAIAIASGFDMTIDLIHVLNSNFVPPLYYQELAFPVEIEKAKSRCKTQLKKELGTYFGNTVSEFHLLEGIPFKEIIDYGVKTNADMIIMASHGHSAINQLLFGSTVDKVVRKSTVPVLSVRDTGRSFELP